MPTTGLQVLGFLVSIAGWVGGALVCATPFWRVSAFVGDELVVSEVLWEGLWMTCLSQLGRIQCKVYDSALALSGSTQFCRVMVILSLLLGLFALPLGAIGMKCTHCLEGARDAKARLVRTAGAIFMAAGVAFFMPVFWTTFAVIRDFYDPNVAPPLKRELGPALYLGGGVAFMMLVGGVMLYQGGSASSVVPTKSTFGKGAGPAKDNPHPTATAEGKQDKAYV
ncbi:claudin-4 [Pangasianodon hypophthalmus]|uniref:claudin-4 n=1 Tax=Pangasianodon hypophthalmus TaxID=310915 RepID=UPI000EFE002E|nr:claudin-4 [Pangasianodon hypophthalmus]